MVTKLGDKPLSEVKTFREVLWALVLHPKCTFKEKLQVGGLLILCRWTAWRHGKGLQDTLQALAMAAHQIKREETEVPDDI